ncbi:MAG: hypothetical protein ABIJ56_21130 [Pseudomonadota bacterium]
MTKKEGARDGMLKKCAVFGFAFAASMAAFLLVAAGAGAQTIVVRDLLTGEGGCTGEECGAGRTVTGGLDFTDQGWVPHGPGDTVMYNLGGPVVSGSLEFTVFNFAPYAQYHCGTGHQYLEFVGLFEGEGGDHWTSFDNDESIVFVLYAPGREEDCTPGDSAPNHQTSMRGALNEGCEWHECFPTVYADPETPADYRFRLEWDATGARLYVTDNPAGEPALVDQIAFDAYPNACTCECEQALVQYVYLGKTNSNDSWFDGPVFSNVVITSFAEYVPQECCPEEEGEAEEVLEGEPDGAVPELPDAVPELPDAAPDRADLPDSADPDAQPDGGEEPGEDGGAGGGCGCAVAR